MTEEARPDEVAADEVQASPPAERFTAPEKIASVAQAVLAQPAGDARVQGVLGAITSPLGRRFLLSPMLALLPPLDEPEEWDAWLAMLVGCALELASDGTEIQVDEAREAARFMLGALFAGEASPA